MQTAIRMNRTILQFCNMTAAELLGRVRVLDSYFGASILTGVMERGVRDIGTVSLLCERSIVAEGVAATDGFGRVAGDIAGDPGTSLSTPGERWFQLGMGYILTMLGERITFGGDDYAEGAIRLREGRLRIDCRGALVAQTLRQIFAGHRQICETMNTLCCKGKWMIHIDRHYHDGAPVQDLIEMLRRMPAEELPVRGSVRHGISMTATAEERPGADSRGMEILATEETVDTLRHPRSLMMNSSLSLYIEGPYFDQYEHMQEVILDAAGCPDSYCPDGCRLVAIDTDEFAGGNNTLKSHLENLFRRQPLGNIAGVLLVQTEREERGAAFTIDLVTNPEAARPLPEDFACAIQGRHRIFY